MMATNPFLDLANDPPDETEARDRQLLKIRARDIFLGHADSAAVSDVPEIKSGVGERAMSPAARKFGQGTERALARAAREAAGLGIKAIETQHRGFWWLLDKIDRPRNALHVATKHVLEGNGSFKDIAGNAWKGMRAEERAEFLDIIDTIEAESTIADVMLPKWIRKGTTPAEIEDPDMRRLAAGFLGDMIYDPLNLIPLTKVGKLKKAVSAIQRESAAPIGWHKTFGENLDATKKTQWGKLLTELNRKTFDLGRTTGNPAFDAIVSARVDTKYAVESGFIPEAIAVSREFDKLRGIQSQVVRLAENRDLDHLRALAIELRRAPNGSFDIDAYLSSADVLKTHRIHNPEAFAEIVKRKDFEAAFVVAKRFRALIDKKQELETIAGKRPNELGGRLQEQLSQNQKKMERAIRKARNRAARISREKAEMGEQSIKAQRELLATIMGKSKIERLVQSLKTSGKEIGTQEQLDEAIRAALSEIGPEFVTGLKKIDANEAALPAFFDHFRMEMLKATKEERVMRLAKERDQIIDTISMVPAYIPHMVSADAAWQIARKGSGKSGNMTMKRALGPETAADIFRKFQTQGRFRRPLSFEEIEDVIANSPEKVTGEIRVVLEGQPLRRRPRWREIVLDKSPEEFANFFEFEDPKKLLELATKEHAQAISQTKFFKDAFELFGKTEKPKNGNFVRLDEIGRGELIGTMPFLKGVYFDHDIARELIRVEKRFSHAASEHPAMKALQLMHDYFISYNLPLLVDFNARNYVGQIANMVDGGWTPYKPRDIRNLVKATQLQGYANTQNIQKIREMKFFAHKGHVTIDGDKMLEMAIHKGIINDGFWTRETGDAFRLYDTPAYRDFKNYIPWNPKNLKIDRNPYIAMGRKAGQFIESHTRLAYFASMIESGKSVDEAAQMTKKYLGNFRAETMTEAEQAIKKFVPFYRWMRFNVPMQWDTIINSDPKRQRLMALLRGQELGQETIERTTGGEEVDVRAEDLPADVPEWIERAAGIPIRRDPRTGELQVFLLENFLPVADLDNFMFPAYGTAWDEDSGFSDLSAPRETAKTLGYSLTPFGQMAQTFATQKNAFTNQDLSKTQKSEFLGKQIPTETRYLLGQIRLLSELDRVDPFSAFHRTRAQDPAYTRIADALGASIQQVNQAQGKINDDKDRLERLRREIARVRKVMMVDEDEKKAKAKGGNNGDSSSPGDKVQAK